MPKTYSEGHKAREITLAEAAIVKLREAEAKALDTRERTLMRLHTAAVDANAKFDRGDWDRKIEAAEAHLAWLRAMPVPPGDEAPAAEA